MLLPAVKPKVFVSTLRGMRLAQYRLSYPAQVQTTGGVSGGVGGGVTGGSGIAGGNAKKGVVDTIDVSTMQHGWYSS